MIVVDQGQLWSYVEVFDCVLYGEYGGMQNVQLVDFFDFGVGDVLGQGFFVDFFEQCFVVGFVEFF